MVSRGIWFERKFTLGLPTWMFPNVVEHPADKRLPERIGVLRRWRSVRLNGSCLSFYEQKYARPRSV